MTTDTDKASDKLVEMALADAYEKGWCAAAQWANRDDLRHDTDSIAYAGQRDAILVGKAGKLIASLCGDVEPVGEVMLGYSTELEKCYPDGPMNHVHWNEKRAVPCAGSDIYSASTVATLKAERDALREKLWAQDVRCGKLEIEKGALKARVAELEKDAARLEFVCNSPNRMVERESGLWRVYEDVAPTDRPTAVWQGITPRWHVTPREAIDAAITAALTKGQP